MRVLTVVVVVMAVILLLWWAVGCFPDDVEEGVRDSAAPSGTSEARRGNRGSSASSDPMDEDREGAPDVFLRIIGKPSIVRQRIPVLVCSESKAALEFPRLISGTDGQVLKSQLDQVVDSERLQEGWCFLDVAFLSDQSAWFDRESQDVIELGAPDSCSTIRFSVNERFRHPILDQLFQLSVGAVAGYASPNAVGWETKLRRAPSSSPLHDMAWSKLAVPEVDYYVILRCGTAFERLKNRSPVNGASLDHDFDPEWLCVVVQPIVGDDLELEGAGFDCSFSDSGGGSSNIAPSRMIDGNVVFVLDENQFADSHNLFLQVVSTPGGQWRRRVLARRNLGSLIRDRTPMWKPGVVDLGRVSIESLATRCSGRVVDENGNGVAGCRVLLPGQIRTAADPLGVTSARVVLSTTHSDGAFSVLDDGSDPSSKSMIFSHEDYVPAVVRDLGFGASNVKVVLTQGARIEGWVDPSIAASNVDVVLSGEKGIVTVRRLRGDDRRISLGSLSPGVYSLSLNVGEGGSAVIDSIAVGQGVVKDPRLNPARVDPAQFFSVGIQSPNGEAVVGVSVVLRSAEGPPGQRRATSDKNGRILVSRNHLGRSVRVAIGDSPMQYLELAEGLIVVVQKGRIFQLDLTFDEELLSPDDDTQDLRVSAEFVPVPDRASSVVGVSQSGTEFQLCVGVTYDVRFVLRRYRAVGAMKSLIATQPISSAGLFSVRGDVVGVEKVTFRVSDDALRAAVFKIRKK